jgi:hypothetical protein
VFDDGDVNDWRTGRAVHRHLKRDDVEFLLSLSRDEAVECVAAWWGEVENLSPVREETEKRKK